MTTIPATLPPPGYEYGEARRRYLSSARLHAGHEYLLQLAVLGLAVVAVGLIRPERPHAADVPELQAAGDSDR